MTPRKKYRNIIFVALSITFIFVVGAFYVYLKNIDERYNLLISKKTETLQSLQKLTAESNKNFFILYDIIHTENNAVIDSLDAVRKSITFHNSEYLENLSIFNLIDSDTRDDYESLLSARKEYIAKNSELLDIRRNQSSKAAARYFSDEIIPRFDAYQKQLENFVVQTKLASDQFCADLSKEVKSATTYFVIIGLIPLVFYLLFIFFNFVFINMMMWRLKDS